MARIGRTRARLRSRTPVRSCNRGLRRGMGMGAARLRLRHENLHPDFECGGLGERGRGTDCATDATDGGW